MGIIRRIESVFWAIAREINTQQVLEGRARPTSFPFISADTFRSLGEFVINNEDRPERLAGFHREKAPRTIYIEMDSMRDRRSRSLALDIIDNSQQKNQKSTRVILNNSDSIPHETFFIALQSLSANVFSVNLQDGFYGAIPIPLGIENWTRRRSGALEDFLIFREQSLRGEVNNRDRSKLILANFRTRTNRKARENLAIAFSKSRHGFSDGGLPIREFRKRMLSAKFVVSPPGNGADCFRTWESIYLGAIPIVLKGYLADSLASSLPIWMVNDWEEVLDKTDEQLDQTFRELSTRKREKAYFTFWQKLISDHA